MKKTPQSYYIESKHFIDKVLDVRGNKTASGTEVILWKRKKIARKNQRFFFHKGRIVSVSANKVLSYDEENKKIVIDSFRNDDDSQIWDIHLKEGRAESAYFLNRKEKKALKISSCGVKLEMEELGENPVVHELFFLKPTNKPDIIPKIFQFGEKVGKGVKKTVVNMNEKVIQPSMIYSLLQTIGKGVFYRGGFVERSPVEQGGIAGIKKYVQKDVWPKNKIIEIDTDELRNEFGDYIREKKVEYSLLDSMKELRIVNGKKPLNKKNQFVILVDGSSMGENTYLLSNIVEIKGLLEDTFGDEKFEDHVLYHHGPGGTKVPDLIAVLQGKAVHQILFRMYRQLFMKVHKALCVSEEVEVFLFGFSRGAFAVLSLANLLIEFGLPKKTEDMERIISEYTKNRSPQRGDNVSPNEESENMFNVKVKFLGLYDCVSTVLEGNQYHKISLKGIEKCYHALSTGELNSCFVPTLPLDTEKGNHRNVWFLGGHVDVGGNQEVIRGNLPYKNPYSNITLIEMCLAASKESGLKFSDTKLREISETKHFNRELYEYADDEYSVHSINWFFKRVTEWAFPVTNIGKKVYSIIEKMYDLEVCRRSHFAIKDSNPEIHSSIPLMATYRNKTTEDWLVKNEYINVLQILRLKLIRLTMAV